jgi:hypothetical protein
MLTPAMTTDVIDRLGAAVASGSDVRKALVECMAVARTLDVAGKQTLLRGLERVLRTATPDRLGDVAILAGAIVEIGGEPRDFPAAVFDHLAAMLDAIPRDADDDYEPPGHFYLFERAAMACLARSPELRQSLPQRAALRGRLRRYAERYGFLGKMLAVLDEPLIVLHPSTERGFRFRMNGVADNFQLHLLLLDALAGTGSNRIEGIVPDAAAVAAATNGDGTKAPTVDSNWQLANWFALRAGGVIDTKDYSRSWIWNEGVPADIAPFDGVRVVLIGPSTIHRSWSSQRVFPAMPGRLVREGDLPAAEVERLLAAMLARSREGAGDAGA